VVGGTLDRRCGHPRAEDSVEHPIDTVDRGPRCKSDGEANVVPSQDSEDAHQREQYEHDDHRREVDHPGWREGAPDGTQDRLGRLDDEERWLRATARIDVGEQHAREDQEEEGEEQDLQEIPQEGIHESESSSPNQSVRRSLFVMLVILAGPVPVGPLAE
jgi:hypothetical protein